MELTPIATFHSPFKSKFGIPKQSGLVLELEGEVVLYPQYSHPDYVRGLEGFDYIWLLWECHANKHALSSAVVRPPVLGGNAKVGVFASRSPFRPNALGLSSVRLLGIENARMGDGLVLKVCGADLMDGTPIIDIKPYLPYTDSHADAQAGFVDSHPTVRLDVLIPEEVAKVFDMGTIDVLRKVLSLDPRPHYHTDPTKIYAFPFLQYDVKFTVADGVCTVVGVDLLVNDAR